MKYYPIQCPSCTYWRGECQRDNPRVVRLVQGLYGDHKKGLGEIRRRVKDTDGKIKEVEICPDFEQKI